MLAINKRKKKGKINFFPLNLLKLLKDIYDDIISKKNISY